MPTYEYKCKGCNHEFSVIMSISEREEAKVKCPKCKSVRVQQVVSSFITKTSRKS